MGSVQRRLALAALLAAATPAAAQCPLDKVTAEGQQADDLFGSDLESAGTTLAVAAVGSDAAGFDRGAAYVFERDGYDWVQRAELIPAEIDGSYRYADCVAHVPGVLAVGAPLYDDLFPTGGAVFVYAADASGAWGSYQTLHPSDPAGLTFFGEDVALRDDLLIVGTAADRVYAFEPGPTGWVETQRIEPSVVQPGAESGSRVALDGDLLAVAAPRLDTPSGAFPGFHSDAGAVFLFRERPGGWIEEAMLLPGDPEPFKQFGHSVDVSGSRVLVGTAHDGDVLTGDASAYVFALTDHGWIQEAKLFAPLPEFGDKFATAVLLAGERAFVGAPGDGDLGLGAGAIHAFERGPAGWEHAGKLVPVESGIGSFGAALALAGDDLFAGATHDTDFGPLSGSAYHLDVGGRGCAPLFAAPEHLSAAAGGLQHLVLEAGAAHAGAIFGVLGSAAGTSPGFPAGGVDVPLAPDAYLVWTLLATGTGPLADAVGTLDGDGRAQATLAVPAAPTLAGLELHHAYVVLDAGLAPAFASNAKPLHIGP